MGQRFLGLVRCLFGYLAVLPTINLILWLQTCNRTMY
jgi:hypothetical protein